MELRIYWTDFAKNELKRIYIYYVDEVDYKIANQITKRIVSDTQLLTTFPESGANEELLLNRPENFRYLISTNYKVIYWVNKAENRIEVVDVFDTRQNPIKMKRGK